MSLLNTLVSICMASLFSCELRGSKASLLGTGVMVEDGRLEKDNALDFVVVSFRQSFDGTGLEAGVAPVVFACDCVADLEKKPRILCCFPVDDIVPTLFLAVDGVLAGVRAGTSELSPIFARK